MKNLREKSRRISGKINAFRKIISERHLIWNAVLVNFRTLCNCYIIPNFSKIDRTLNLPCSVHLDARPIPLMSVFSFRATSCTLRGDLSTSCAYFYFVQHVTWNVGNGVLISSISGENCLRHRFFWGKAMSIARLCRRGRKWGTCSWKLVVVARLVRR